MAPRHDGTASYASAAEWAVSHAESTLVATGEALIKLDALITGSSSRPLAYGCLLFTLFLAHTAVQWWRTRDLPPHAQPWLPIVGNALRFRRAPADFVCRMAAKHKSAGCFTVDLAGLSLHILSGEEAMDFFFKAPEAVLSEQAAALDFGECNVCSLLLSTV